MAYYDHATLMALRLGPWAPVPQVTYARYARRRRCPVMLWLLVLL